MAEPATAEVINEPGTELVVQTERKPALVAGNPVRAIVPRTVEEAFRLAQAVVRAGLAPDSYKNDPQKILIGIMKACEVGLPPLTGLSSIAIINGRPAIWGDGAIALIQSSGHVQKMESHFVGTVDKDDYTAIFRVWRKGQDSPYEGKFSVADAKRAKLWANPQRAPWMLYPNRMLMNRARAYALRDGFADCLSGLAIAEEVQDIPEKPDALDTGFLEDRPEIEGTATDVTEAGAEDKDTAAQQPADEPSDWEAIADQLIKGYDDCFPADRPGFLADNADQIDQMLIGSPAAYDRFMEKTGQKKK